MKASQYIKNYFINDIILLLILCGLTWLAVDARDRSKTEEETTVELVPLNISENDEIG